MSLRQYPFAASRSAAPVTLEEAARYSKMPESYDPYVLVEALRHFKRAYKPLKRALNKPTYEGPCRPRKSGAYELLYIFFERSGCVDVFNWFHTHRSDERMWRACGFDPEGVSYATVQRRFAELEEYEYAFDLAKDMCVRTASRHVPEIGGWLHVDATEASTSARLKHDCRPGEGCQGHHTDIPMTMIEAADGRRQLANVAEENIRPDDDHPTTLSYIESFTKRPGEKRKRRDRRRVYRLGHWWSSTDLEAGTRKQDKKIWDGYGVSQVVDHVTGLALQTRVYPADQNETTVYADLVERTIRSTGKRPIAIAGDRGYDLTHIYRFNNSLGIGSAIHKRSNQRPPKGIDYDKVPTCKHCEGGTDFHSYVEIEPGTWELRFTCSLPMTDDCERIQSLRSSTNPKYVVPLWGTNPIYVELTTTHQAYERYHFQTRRRNQTGPKSHTQAPRRTGLACQQLRATVGNLLNWLTLCLKYGWIRGYATRFEVKRNRNTDGAWVAKYEKRNARRRDTAVLGGGARVRRE